MKTTLFLLLTFCCLQSSIAQLADGYYINKTGDTIRDKIEIPLKPKVKLGASSQTNADPLQGLVDSESTKIDFTKLTFDFKFSENNSKAKKFDRLKVKGFGFNYEGVQYDFTSWDVTSNKQIFLIPATGDVAPDGVYFILRSVEGRLPIYSLFQEVEMTKRKLDNRPDLFAERYDKQSDGWATKRDVIFKHPSKGFIYISDQYPLKMKFADALAYLEFENDFVKTLSKNDNLLDAVKKYNKWKKE